MTRAPRVTAREVIHALGKAGFQIVRTKGSHYRLAHEDGRRTTVPYHAGRIFKPKLLAGILSDCNLTYEEFLELLDK